jgi:hypothetical protein
MDQDTITQLLVTTAGVLLSFALWFGGERLIKNLLERTARKSLMKELLEELKFNINILDQQRKGLIEMINNHTVPLFIPKLSNIAAKFAVTSGEVRLCGNFDKQRIVRLIVDLYDRHNAFSENTENVLIRVFGLPNANQIAALRLKGEIENWYEHEKVLLMWLKQLEQNSQFSVKSPEKSATRTDGKP